MRSSLDRTMSLWADFNSVDDEWRVRTSLRFAKTLERPRPGELIWLYDDEGNAVWGVVDELQGLVIYVRLEMATWTSEVTFGRPFRGVASSGRGELQTSRRDGE